MTTTHHTFWDVAVPEVFGCVGFIVFVLCPIEATPISMVDHRFNP